MTYKALWQDLGWNPTNQQIQKLIELQEILNHLNKEVNLTRLLKDDDYWINQILDSLLPLKEALSKPLQPINCIDVGSGSGFPGIALAIALPDAQFTLIEATRKKTNALEKIIKQLDLTKQVAIRTERIELTGQNKNFRGMFDIAMARAVAKAPILAEYLIPLIKQSGEAILYKGKLNKVEEQELMHSLVPLNGKIKSIEKLFLPKNRGERNIIRLQLQPSRQCPSKYPRAIGIPSKRPLGSQVKN